MGRLFPITISLDNEHLSKLDDLAGRKGDNRSAVVRELIREATTPTDTDATEQERIDEAQS